MKKILISLFMVLSLQAQDKPTYPTVECEQCAILVTNSIEEYKKTFENEDSFYSSIEHTWDYLYTTEKYLELQGIQIKRFPSTNKIFVGKYPIDNPKEDYFQFILYKKGKAPYIIQDIVMPEDEINKYFELKNPKEPAPAVPKLVSDCSVICQECGLLYKQSYDFEDNFKKQFKSNADYSDNYIAIISQRLVKIQVKLDSMGIKNLSNSLTGPNVSDCPNLNFDGYILQAQPNLYTYILYKKGKKPHILKDLKNPNIEIEEYFSKD